MSALVDDIKSEKVAEKEARRTDLGHRRKGLWVGGLVLLNLAFLYLLLALVEVGLRFAARKMPLNGLHGGVRYTWGLKVVNNRFGFREREFTTPKPASTWRAMVLGDSVTWGPGLSEAERYTGLLESHLRAVFPEVKIEVLNFGIPGGPTVKERDILREYVDLVQPDLVIVGFCFNDPQPRDMNWSVERERFKPLFWGIAKLQLLGLARFSELLGSRMEFLLERFNLIPRWQVALQRAYEPDSSEWREFVQALRDMKNLCEKRGLPPPIFAILNQGSDSRKPTDYNNPDEDLQLMFRWWRQAEEAAHSVGLITVNFEDEFRRELANVHMGVNLLDPHPGRACHQIYARKLGEILSTYIREWVGITERGRKEKT